MLKRTKHSVSHGGIVLHMMINVLDRRLAELSFQTIECNGVPLEGTFQITPYGVKTDYQGEFSEDVEAALEDLNTYLHKKYRVNWEPELERNDMEDITPEPPQGEPQGENRESEEVTIEPSDIGEL